LYLTNLTDEQWQLLCPVLEIAPARQKGGRPRSYPFREIVNGIFYITKTGCQWRMLPSDFAPWSSVYGYFRTWKLSGVWDNAKLHCTCAPNCIVTAHQRPFKLHTLNNYLHTLTVITCNRKPINLQSAQFSTGINYN